MRKKKQKIKEEEENKKVKDMTEEELINLIRTEINKENRIEAVGVSVSSTTASLKEVEKTINRIIERHKDFLLMKREFDIKTGYKG